MERKRANKILYIVLITLLLAVTALIGGWGNSPAFADTSPNTSVLSDLQKDTEFSADNYPVVKDDYSIQVIQIGESEKGNLYIYTYQPCQPVKYLIATDINMSLSKEADITQLYELVLVNTSGVFAKYFVKGVTASSAAVRYYNITSIYRAWDKDIDGDTDNNNTGEKKSFPVRRVYTATILKDGIDYSYEPTYTVNIINPYSDYLIYTNYEGLPSISSIRLSFEKHGYIDAHYIAFSTDWEIDKLMSATVTYRYCTGNGRYETFLGFDCGGDLTYGTEQVGYAYPSYDDKFEDTGDILHNGTIYHYSWERIQTVAEFIASEENLTEETKNNLAGKQWVLRFLETKRTQTETGIVGYKKYQTEFTKVDKVAVLRLEFETDGKVYNLGAVSDIVSGDLFPGNAGQVETQTFWEWLAKLLGVNVTVTKAIFWVIVVVIILAITLPVLSAIFPAVGQFLKLFVKGIGYGLKYLFIGLWWLICLPFKGIGALFKMIKQRTSERKQRKEEERQAKLEQEQQMRLYKHRADLERKENKRQQKLDDKDAKKAQKAKDKQTAKHDKKAVKKRLNVAKNKNRGKGKRK